MIFYVLSAKWGERIIRNDEIMEQRKDQEDEHKIWDTRWELYSFQNHDKDSWETKKKDSNQMDWKSEWMMIIRCKFQIHCLSFQWAFQFNSSHHHHVSGSVIGKITSSPTKYT